MGQLRSKTIAGEDGPFPEPALAMQQNREHQYVDCQSSASEVDPVSCLLGNENNAPNAVLIGDSHATAWMSALDQIAENQNLTIKTLTRSGCTPVPLDTTVAVSEVKNDDELCEAFIRDSFEEALSSESIEYVFLGASTRPDNEELRSALPEELERLKESVNELLEGGKKVIALEEIPHFASLGQTIPECLEENEGAPELCTQPVDDVLGKTKLLTDLKEEVPEINSVNVNDMICDEEVCHAQVGTLMVYRDRSHLTDMYVEALVPEIESQLIAQHVFPDTERKK